MVMTWGWRRWHWIYHIPDVWIVMIEPESLCKTTGFGGSSIFEHLRLLGFKRKSAFKNSKDLVIWQFAIENCSSIDHLLSGHQTWQWKIHQFLDDFASYIGYKPPVIGDFPLPGLMAWDSAARNPRKDSYGRSVYHYVTSRDFEQHMRLIHLKVAWAGAGRSASHAVLGDQKSATIKWRLGATSLWGQFFSPWFLFRVLAEWCSVGFKHLPPKKKDWTENLGENPEF